MHEYRHKSIHGTLDATWPMHNLTVLVVSDWRLLRCDCCYALTNQHVTITLCDNIVHEPKKGDCTSPSSVRGLMAECCLVMMFRDDTFDSQHTHTNKSFNRVLSSVTILQLATQLRATTSTHKHCHSLKICDYCSVACTPPMVTLSLTIACYYCCWHACSSKHF
jgi:hypothetical protein